MKNNKIIKYIKNPENSSFEIYQYFEKLKLIENFIIEIIKKRLKKTKKP